MVTIRKCNADDIPLVLDLAIKSYRETYEYLWDDRGDAYVSSFYSKEILEREIAMQGVSYFLVYTDGGAAGYFKTTENTLAPGENKDSLEIDKIYFLSQFKRKGIGKQVMLFIENLARVQHKTQLWLKVMDSSTAIPFYRDHGFTPVKSTRLDYPHMKDEFRVILTFTRRLNVLSSP